MDFDRLDVLPCGVSVAAEVHSAVECDIVRVGWSVCRVRLAYGFLSVLGDEVDVV